MRILVAAIVLLSISEVTPQNVDASFLPDVTASCRGGYMEVRIVTNNLNYKGMIHARDYRNEACSIIGDGSNTATLRIPIVTDKDDPAYCGIRVNATSNDKYLPVSVRIHEELELADDKFYVIKCGLQGYYTTKNETSFVNLQLLDDKYQKTKEAVMGRQYYLKADVSKPDRAFGIRVKNCFSFGEPNATVQLTDDRGCPDRRVISKFKYNATSGTAEATLYEMFKFDGSNRVHFQCDVVVCKSDECEEVACEGNPERLTVQGRALPDGQLANSIDERNKVMASTSVYVVEPGVVSLHECGWYPPWLWILCIALGVLFIIMMIINIFLCSAMTCSCTKTEVIEKEPSMIDEFDPYRSWHGSQYGSRYSLNGKGYTSGASTMNSARSVSSHSDHYAIVASRPHSRYSGGHSLKNGSGHHSHHHHHNRGPPSTTGSHYSGRM